MKKYKCVISYDGTRYAGFQIQENALTIQQTLQEIFSKRLQEKVMVLGASRTDAKVHALGQVIHFETDKIADQDHFLYQVNCMLPKDIRILTIEEIAHSFHSRYDAKKKTYFYFLQRNPFSPPFGQEFKLFLPKGINLNEMKEGAKYFLGTHDFRAFAHQSEKGCAKNKPIKTIYRFDFIENGDEIRIEVEGNGFLHKMIRNMVGLLLDVGMGRIAKESIPMIIASKDRKKAGQTAPGHALFLAKIDYND
jgi:tRNA pseudouridine38-40 synthase